MKSLHLGRLEWIQARSPPATNTIQWYYSKRSLICSWITYGIGGQSDLRKKGFGLDFGIVSNMFRALHAQPDQVG